MAFFHDFAVGFMNAAMADCHRNYQTGIYSDVLTATDAYRRKCF